jgi:hypothetical protein
VALAVLKKDLAADERGSARMKNLELKMEVNGLHLSYPRKFAFIRG